MIPHRGLGERPIDAEFNLNGVVNKEGIARLTKFVQNSTKVSTVPLVNQTVAPVFASPAQRRVLDIVTAHSALPRRDASDLPKPLNLISVGESGAGKTWLIKEIVKVLRCNLARFATAAFTGGASNSIDGMFTNYLLG